MHSYVRTSKLKTKEGRLPLILFIRGWVKPMLPHNIPPRETTLEQRCKDVSTTLQRCVALNIVVANRPVYLSGNKSHKLWLLVVMKFPQPLFFFSFDQSERKHFCIRFCFCLLAFFSFFSKSGVEYLGRASF